MFLNACTSLMCVVYVLKQNTEKLSALDKADKLEILIMCIIEQV